MRLLDKNECDCKICPLGKHISRNPDTRAGSPLEMVHCDLVGPINPVSINHSKYTMIFVDDFSNLFWIYFLKNKSDACAATDRFLGDTSPHG